MKLKKDKFKNITKFILKNILNQLITLRNIYIVNTWLVYMVITTVDAWFEKLI